MLSTYVVLYVYSILYYSYRSVILYPIPLYRSLLVPYPQTMQDRGAYAANTRQSKQSPRERPGQQRSESQAISNLIFLEDQTTQTKLTKLILGIPKMKFHKFALSAIALLAVSQSFSRSNKGKMNIVCFSCRVYIYLLLRCVKHVVFVYLVLLFV